MAIATIDYGSYTAMTVTSLQSLANDSSDPFGGWQSDRVSNLSAKAIDYNIIVDLSTAATAAANDKAAYVFLIPWMSTDGGTTWIAGGNFGTTTLPTGAEGTCTITEPNSMILAATLPYKDTSQRLQGGFSISSIYDGPMPDGWSLAIRDATGAALGTGCVVAYKAIKYASA
jgi:hypothetical protein